MLIPSSHSTAIHSVASGRITSSPPNLNLSKEITGESTPIKHGNSSRDSHQPSHQFGSASHSSQETLPSTSFNNPESHGIQSTNVSSSSDDSVEQISGDPKKEKKDVLYDLKVKYLKEKASNATAALKARKEEQIDELTAASKAQKDILEAALKAQIDTLEGLQWRHNIRLKKTKWIIQLLIE